MKGYFILFCLTLFLSCSEDESDNISIDEIISMSIINLDNSPLTSPIIGDGEKIIKAEVFINPEADDQYQTVTFTLNKGAFLNSLTPLKTDTRADNDGVATVEFKLPLSDEFVTIKAEIGTNEGYYVTKTIDLVPVNEVLSLNIISEDDTELEEPPLADGENILKLKTKFLFNVASISEINIKCNTGTFVANNSTEINAPLDSNWESTIFYKVTQKVEPIFFTVKVGHNDQTYELIKRQEIDLAYPSQIYLEPTHILFPENTTENALNVYLKRTQGKVSEGLPVSFTAFQIDTLDQEIQVGRFTGLFSANSNAEEFVSGVKFHTDTNDIDSLKDVHIVSYAPINSDNIMITDTVKVRLTN